MINYLLQMLQFFVNLVLTFSAGILLGLVFIFMYIANRQPK
jgi:hypothetical protein